MKPVVSVIRATRGKIVHHSIGIMRPDADIIDLDDEIPAEVVEQIVRLDIPEGTLGEWSWKQMHIRQPLVEMLVCDCETVNQVNRDRSRAIEAINERADELIRRLPKEAADMRENDILDQVFWAA